MSTYTNASTEPQDREQYRDPIAELRINTLRHRHDQLLTAKFNALQRLDVPNFALETSAAGTVIDASRLFERRLTTAPAQPHMRQSAMTQEQRFEQQIQAIGENIVPVPELSIDDATARVQGILEQAEVIAARQRLDDQTLGKAA